MSLWRAYGVITRHLNTVGLKTMTLSSAQLLPNVAASEPGSWVDPGLAVTPTTRVLRIRL